MVGGGDFARLLAPLEEWKLGDPDEFEGALVDQPKGSGRRLTDRSQRRRCHLRAVCHRDHHIAGLRPCRLVQTGKLQLGEELRYRRAPALRLPMPEGEALCSVAAGGLGKGIDLLAADCHRNAKTAHHPAGIQRLPENLELGAREDRRQLLDLEPVSKIGLVHPVPKDRVRVGDTADGCGQGHAKHLLPDVREAAFYDVEHVVLSDEGQLEIELGELRLAVGALVLVPVAAHDLEVAVHAGHHQELLVELRRLRERVDVAGLQAAGNQVITRPFWGTADQNRRLDLNKAFVVEKIPNSLGHPVPELEIPGHPLPPKIQVTVAKAQLLIDHAILVDSEGRRLCAVEDIDPLRIDLDRTGGELLVFRSRWALDDRATDVDHGLQPQLAARRMRLGMHRIELHLDDPTSVAQVDEDQAAQVTPAVHPTIDVDGLPSLLDPERATLDSGCPAHPALKACVTVGTTSRSATLTCVFKRMSRTTASPFSRSSRPTSRATRAPRLAALRSLASSRAAPVSTTTRKPRSRKVPARWKT